MRTAFIIDGFNLYHSLQEVHNSQPGLSVKWLDLCSLCSSYLPQIDTKAKLADIYYCTAFAHHKELSKPGTVTRHNNYIACLKATGVNVRLGRFKKRLIKRKIKTKTAEIYLKLAYNEEKETDVALTAHLFELLINNACDTVVIVTGDTDIIPAIKTARSLFPKMLLYFLFPHKRKNKELAKLADGSFNLRPPAYAKHQFPDPVVLPDGRRIRKPTEW